MSDSPAPEARAPAPQAAAPKVDTRAAAPQASVGAMVQLSSQVGQAQALGGMAESPPTDSATGGAQELMAAAQHGTAQASDALPHLGAIQASFGKHDVTGVKTQTGGAAAQASAALGAQAYAMGDRVAFAQSPDLHTAAHEAAHVVQQQKGVQLKGAAGGAKLGKAGDKYERHADAVADAVVRGESAEALLDQHPGGGGGAAVQRIEDAQPEDRTTESRHVIVRGDTLSRLARRHLGDPKRWREIKARNPDRVHGRDTIIVGQVLILPASVVEEGGGGGEPGGETEAVTPVEMVRTSVDAQDGLSALQTWGTLSAEERGEIVADADLFARFMGVLSRAQALPLVAEAGEVPAQLERAALRSPVEAEFLTAALRQAGIEGATGLIAHAATLSTLPGYADAAVLGPLVNGDSTADDQVQMLVDPSCWTLIEAAFGPAPLTYMEALIADPALAREAMLSFEAVRAPLLADPVALYGVAMSDTEPAAWLMTLIQIDELAQAGQFIAQDQMTWGEILLPELSTLTEAQTTAINDDDILQSQIIAACLLFGGDTMALDVALGLRLDMAQALIAFHAAGVLTAEMCTSLLITATPAEQKVVAESDPAMGVVVLLHAEGDPLVLFAPLVTTPTDFTAATIAGAVFAGWVARDALQLRAIIVAVQDDPGWIASFQHHGNWALLLSMAADPALTDRLRAGLIATAGSYTWLVGACDHPLTDDAQAQALLALYGLGTGIALADKYTTWDCLYTAKLGRAGDDIVRTWGAFTTHEKRWVAVDPNDQAMDLYFNQMRQIPRNHINTASLVIMCPHFTHFVSPVFSADHFVDADGNEIAAPGHNAMGTSYYFGSENAIVMRATSAAGTPSTAAIGNRHGSPGAVNTPQTGPLSPNAPRSLSYFENHVTHEFGHSVGARTLNRDGYNTTPNDWTKTYADWKNDSSAEDYARTLGFTQAMDDTEYTLTVGATTLEMDGDDIREFLTDFAEGDDDAGDDPADHFGSVAAGMTAIKSDPTLAGNLLVRTIDTMRSEMPNRTFTFPHGIDPGATRVHFYCTRWGNDWVSYDRSALDNRVSWYELSSYKEMFAEMYTAKYTGGALPPAIGGRSATDFFASLEAASPEELGMESGESGSGDTAEDAAGAAGGAAAGEGGFEQDPNAGDIRPWP